MSEPLTSVSLLLSCFFDTVVELQLGVLFVVAAFYFLVFGSSSISMFNTSGGELEFLWTAAPLFLLGLLSVPSVLSLYVMDDAPHTDFFKVQVGGFQWYWEFMVSLLPGDSFSVLFNCSAVFPDLADHLLLSATVGGLLPSGAPLEFRVSSSDVIHSFAVPAASLKADAVPGKVNLVYSEFTPGVFYGQCSELCGANHTNMPIVLVSF